MTAVSQLSPPASLAWIETPFISVTSVVADVIAKQAGVRLLGFEPTGIETIVVRLGASNPADLVEALACGRATALRLGAGDVPTALQARPSEAIFHLNDNPVTINPLYGGRDEMRPSLPITMKPSAIGILETQGLTAVLNATDAMLKAANVTLVGKEKIGAAYVAIIVAGDVAAVTASLEAGRTAVGELGKLIAAHVIARPHEDLIALLPAK